MAGRDIEGPPHVVIRHGRDVLHELDTEDLPALWRLKVGNRYVMPDGESVEVLGTKEELDEAGYRFTLFVGDPL